MKLYLSKELATLFVTCWPARMLGYFPAPYEDELLYSIVARYALHTGLSSNQKAVVREVFSSSTAVAISDLPSRLQALVNNLQLVWPTDVKQIITSHTLAPIYLPFLSRTQATKVMQSMRSNTGGSIHTRAGIAASGIKPQVFFRYCPECIKIQFAEFGEYYWRRIHQLPSLSFCKEHSCKLESSPAFFHPKEKHLFAAAESTRLDASATFVKLNEIEMLFHDRYAELLQSQQNRGFGPNRWSQFYRHIASHLGLLYKTRVQHREIKLLLENKWRKTSLELFVEGEQGTQWIVDIFRKHRKSFHPLRHLMVTSALVPQWSVNQIFEMVSRLPDKRIETISASQSLGLSKNEIHKQRKKWIVLMSSYPDAGVKALRLLHGGGAVYAWLYRHDKQWLMSNKPEKKIRADARYVTDYRKWDESNVELLESEYGTLVNKPNRPRLTQTRCIKMLPRSNSVEKHLDDLPNTSKWLTSHQESVEDYQIRRLHVAFSEIKANNLEVKRWRLVRLANIRKELITQRLETEIQILKQKGASF